MSITITTLRGPRCATGRSWLAPLLPREKDARYSESEWPRCACCGTERRIRTLENGDFRPYRHKAPGGEWCMGHLDHADMPADDISRTIWWDYNPSDLRPEVMS